MPRALSVTCLLGAFAAGSALAQQPGRTPGPPPPSGSPVQRAAHPQSHRAVPASAPVSGGTVMHFRKPADVIVPISGSGVPTRPAIPVPPALAVGGQEKPVPVPSDDEIAKYTKVEGPERIFAMPNDEGLQRLIRDRMIKENPEAAVKDVRFPLYQDVGGGAAYVPKTASYPPMRVTYDPLYVVHRRLHFEDKNTERYGWDLGIIQPAVSAVLFYKDVFCWPHSLASGCVHGFWDTSAGKCLPGSPTPYMLYPPGLTITGSVFETVMVTGLAFAIP